MTLLSGLLPKYCKHLIGVSKRTRSFVFLRQNSWLRSIDIANLALGRDIQHFYVPEEYMSIRHEVLPMRTMVFCLRGELAVAMNGLNSIDMKVLE